MKVIIYHRHCFLQNIISHVICVYFRFTLRFQGVEEVMDERGMDVSYEMTRRPSPIFGLAYNDPHRRGYQSKFLGLILIRSDEIKSALSFIKCLTLILAGQDDIICPAALHQDMADKIPQEDFRILPECGHISTLECPNAVNETLLVFWGKLTKLFKSCPHIRALN